MEKEFMEYCKENDDNVNKRLVYQLFLYAFDKSLLTDKVLDKLKKLSNQSLILKMTT
jgi:hypothetical protein